LLIPWLINPTSEPREKDFLYHHKSGIINLLIESKNIVSLVRIIFWRSCASFSFVIIIGCLSRFFSRIPQENYYTYDSLVVSIKIQYSKLSFLFSPHFLIMKLFIRFLLYHFEMESGSSVDVFNLFRFCVEWVMETWSPRGDSTHNNFHSLIFVFIDASFKFILFQKAI
jgi:hypothetical protein